MSIFIIYIQQIRRWLRRSEVGPIFGLTAALIAIGIFGFMRLEGLRFLDAIYLTIITITTVGYGDLSPQTPAGRIFSIFFTFVAIGIGGYAITSFAAYLIESRAAKQAKYLRKRRMKRIEELEGHYILCGAGMLGVRIAEEFAIADEPHIIIDEREEKLKMALLFSHPDYFERKVRSAMDIVEDDLSEYEEKSLPEVAELLGTPYILDNPVDDSALVRAGIERAAGVIAAREDARDNLAIIIGARALANRSGNTDLRIMSSSDASGIMRKMYLAGADMVRMPELVSGVEMALHMMNPDLGAWWYQMMGLNKSKAPFRMNQIAVSDREEWIGKTVSQIHHEFNTVSLAVKRGEDYYSPPAADLALKDGDVLIVLANRPGMEGVMSTKSMLDM